MYRMSHVESKPILKSVFQLLEILLFLILEFHFWNTNTCTLDATGLITEVPAVTCFVYLFYDTSMFIFVCIHFSSVI